MGSPRYGALIVLGIIFASLLLYPNFVSADETYSSPIIEIAVTQPVIGKILEEVFGNYVNVVSLIPPGVDPHHYEPPLGEILDAIKNCEAIFTSGPHHLAIEDKIMQLSAEGYITIPVYTLEDYMKHGLKILKVNERENYHGALMSYSGSKALIEAFLEFVSQEHPEVYAEMEKVANGYLNALKAVLDEASSRFENLKVALYSPVLQYALYDINVPVEIILTEDPEIPPTINELQTLYEYYQTKRIDLVIITDVDLRADSKIEEYLQRNGIEYVKIDVLGKSPLEVYGQLAFSESISNTLAFEPEKDTISTYALYISIILNVMLIILALALINKIRRS